MALALHVFVASEIGRAKAAALGRPKNKADGLAFTAVTTKIALHKAGLLFRPLYLELFGKEKNPNPWPLTWLSLLAFHLLCCMCEKLFFCL